MKYSIGQVLYVLMNRETKICPVQVVEEITKKSLNGETTNYVVRTGAKGETISLSDLDGQIFDSIDTLKQTLHKKVVKMIDIVAENSEKRAKQWFFNEEKSLETNVEEIQNTSTNTDDAIVILPDGTKAKVKIPLSGT
jgi:hypothetical protein